MRRFDNVFLKVAEVGFKYWRVYLVCFGILAVASPTILRGLRIETASANFITESDPVSKAYRESLNRFGESGQLIVEIILDGVEDGVSDRFTDRLAQRIGELPEIVLVEKGPTILRDDPRAIALTRAAVLNSGPVAATNFAAAFEREEIRRRLLRTRKRLVLSGDPRDRRLLAMDVLDIGEFLKPFVEPRLPKGTFVHFGSYFDSPDRTSRLLLVQPAAPAESTAYCERLVAAIEGAIAEARAATPEAAGLECRITGKYAMIGESSIVLRRDMMLLSASAFVLVLLMIILLFKDWRTAVICMAPIALSLLPVMIVARLFFNPMNFLAIGFVAIIVGLAVDVMLHCTMRLFQFASDGDLQQAVARTLGDCGPPITVGVLTTAGAFASLCFADYEALVQFGLLTASGLLISFAFSILAFPAVVRAVLSGRKTAPLAVRLTSWPVCLLWRSWNHPRVVVAFTVLLIVGASAWARSFAFDTSFRRLFPGNLASLDVAEELSARFGTSFLLSTQLVLSADTYEQGIATQLRIDGELARLVADGSISSFQSPTLYFPAPPGPDVRDAMELAASRIERHRDFFNATLSELEFADASAYHGYFEHLRKAASLADGPVSAAVPELLEEVQLRRLVAIEDGRYHFQTYTWPTGSSFDSTSSRRLRSLFASFDLPAGVELQVTGTHVLYEHLNELVGSNFARVSAISALTIILLTYGFFGRISLALLCLLPLLAALSVTFALIVLADLAFSPLAIGTTAMIMGIGIDYAVHILARWRLEPGRDIRQVVSEIAPIITLTAASTIVGFGVLSFANHDILSFIGKVVAFGVFACWFFCLVSLPAFCLWRRRNLERWFPASLVAAVLVLCPLRASAQEGTVEAYLTTLETNYSSVRSLSCRFRQRKEIQLLENAVDLEGMIFFKKPHSLRVEWRGDENMDLLCDGETVWIVDHDLGEIESYPFSPTNRAGRLAQLVPPIFFLEVAELEESFAITLISSPEESARLRFEPLDGAHFAFVEFTADVDRRGRVKRVETVFSNGDRSTLEFSDWDRHREIPDERFAPQDGKAPPPP